MLVGLLLGLPRKQGAYEMNQFVKGFLKGCRETPRGYFAPLIVIWNLLKAAAEATPGPSEGHRQGH